MSEQPVDNRRGRHEQPSSQHQRKSPQSFGRTRPTWDGPTTNLGTYDPAATLVMEKITDRPNWDAVTQAFMTTTTDNNHTSFPLNTEPKAINVGSESKEEPKRLTPGLLMEAGLNGVDRATATPDDIESLRHLPGHSAQKVIDLDEIMFTVGVELVRLRRDRNQVFAVLQLLSHNPLLIRDVNRALSDAKSGDDFERSLQSIHKEKNG